MVRIDPLPRPQILVFDMDGTLMDVTASYREVVPMTACHYLRILGLAPPPLSGDVYEPFKQMTGFNDDWDLTAGLLALLLSKLPLALPLADGLWQDQESFVRALQEAATPLAGQTPGLPALKDLVQPVRQAGGGLEGLRQIIGTNNAHLVQRGGDARTTNLVERIFSEIYMGSELFARAYGVAARYHQGPGLIEREQVLISRPVLEALKGRGRLGIATGRMRFEAVETLDMHGLTAYFDTLATMDDAFAAQDPGGISLLKPHPFLLQKAADALDPSGLLVAAYVGDVPDDVVAAQAANGRRRWLSIALTTSPNSVGLRESYLALGADRVFAHPDELLTLWDE